MCGEKTLNCEVKTMARDHPRVCGEKKRMTGLARLEKGSPPRVRGKVPVTLDFNNRGRDHPRVCGEKQLLLLSVRRVKGSPPRVRGKVTAI